MSSALIEFCEEKYVYNQYIYEFFNSVSNLFYLLVANKIYDNNGPMGGALVLVGVGSFLLHSTGTFAGQLVDELSMVSLLNIVHCQLGEDIRTKILMGISTVIIMYLYYLLRLHWIFLSFFTFQVLVVMDVIFVLAVKDAVVSSNFIKFLILFTPAITAWAIEQHFCRYHKNFYLLHSVWHALSALSLIYISKIINAIKNE